MTERRTADTAAIEPPPPALGEFDAAAWLESHERADIVGRFVELSDGSAGTIAHVEYEPPERVALVEVRAPERRPLIRAAIDPASPRHLPRVVRLEPRGGGGDRD